MYMHPYKYHSEDWAKSEQILLEKWGRIDRSQGSPGRARHHICSISGWAISQSSYVWVDLWASSSPIGFVKYPTCIYERRQVSMRHIKLCIYVYNFCAMKLQPTCHEYCIKLYTV